MQLNKALVRPNRTKTSTTVPGLQNPGPALHSMDVVFDNARELPAYMPAIRNFYTTGKVLTPGGSFQVSNVLLDSAAITNTANMRVVQALNLKTESIGPTPVCMADNTMPVVNKKVACDITISGITRRITCYVIDGANGNLPYSFLIGIPGLHRYRATIDFTTAPFIVHFRETLDSPPVIITRDSPKSGTGATIPQGIIGNKSKLRMPAKSTFAKVSDASNSEGEEELTEDETEQEAAMEASNEYARRGMRPDSATASDEDSGYEDREMRKTKLKAHLGKGQRR